MKSYKRDREKLNDDIENWEEEKYLLSQKTKTSFGENISLDVGGRNIKVSKETLTSVEGCVLEKLFSGR